jgi:hypothetical protein
MIENQPFFWMCKTYTKSQNSEENKQPDAVIFETTQLSSTVCCGKMIAEGNES